MLTGFLAVVGYVRSTAKEMGDVKQRVVAVETKVNLFWGALESELPKLLHSPGEPKFDDLLEKLRDKTINYEELLSLKQITVERVNEEDGKRIARILLLPIIEERLQKLKPPAARTKS